MEQEKYQQTVYYNSYTIPTEIWTKTDLIAEQIFGTAHDPSQIPINEQSLSKLRMLHADTIMYKVVNNQPVGWIVTVPTTKELANCFLEGQLTEKELFDKTQPQAIYEALYLCAAITVPEYRRQGIATELFKRVVRSIPLVAKPLLFAWPTTELGEKAVAGGEELGFEVKIRKEQDMEPR
ncbi:MAG: hypothetical protein V1707_03680 [bacterium]